MAQQDPEEGLADLIDQLAKSGDRKDQVSLGDIEEAIGQRSFGPFLLVPAIIEVSPIGGIPGLPPDQPPALPGPPPGRGEAWGA